MDVLVGDGKTYEHLQRVKRVYGSALESLLIFPGDWHILKNYQPVLMKAYYHTGLLDIAKATGKAETLKLLEKCSHLMPCLPSILIHYDNTNSLSSMLTFSLDSLSFNTAQMKYILCLTIHKDSSSH